MEYTPFTTDPQKARKWTTLVGDPSKIIDALYQRVEQLEKENAELREEIARLKRIGEG